MVVVGFDVVLLAFKIEDPHAACAAIGMGEGIVAKETLIALWTECNGAQHLSVDISHSELPQRPQMVSWVKPLSAKTSLGSQP